MKLLLLRSVWSGANDLDELIEQTAAAGFNGIEGPVPKDESERRKLRQWLSDRHLAFIAEATTGTDPDSERD